MHSSTAAAPEIDALIREDELVAFNDEPAPWSVPAHEAIADWAYALFLARGARHGSDLEDWLQAERALVKALSAAGLPPTRSALR